MEVKEGYKKKLVSKLGDLYTGFDITFDHAISRAIEIVNETKEDEGHWNHKIVLNDDGYRDFLSRRWYCSECGEWQTYGETRYCPNCGAKMEGR